MSRFVQRAVEREMEIGRATDAADNKPLTRASRRRWQFSLLSLFLLTTATCLILSWWVWPRPVEVVAIVNAIATPLPVSSALTSESPPEFVVCQDVLLRKLRSPDLLEDAVAIPGNGNLRMFRNRSEPTKWLEKRLRIEVVQPSAVVVSLKVPERFVGDAVEVVDYITTRCVSRTLVEVGRQTREHASALIAEQKRVRRQLVDKSVQLAQWRRKLGAEHREVVALEAEVFELTERTKRLTAEILNAQNLDNSSRHLQLVQMATAVTNGN